MTLRGCDRKKLSGGQANRALDLPELAGPARCFHRLQSSKVMSKLSRRNYLKLLGAGAAVAASGPTTFGAINPFQAAQQSKPPAESPAVIADRERRMKWWHEAKFGMFIHWGLYSTLGRQEWVMENEGIPVSEYEKLAPNFHPNPNPPRAWAQLAKRSGMKYMGRTTNHHEAPGTF